MFLHVSTTVHSISIQGDECLVSASVETARMTARGMWADLEIDFKITIPATEIEDAYDRAVAKGHAIFARFNANQKAA